MDNITIQDFTKLDLRIAKVKAAELVLGTDKLLKLTLDCGELGERIIASSIKPWYEPEELIGKNILYLANLEPRTFKGVTSQGMLIAAEDDKGNCVLLVTDKEISPGTKAH
jgi:methionine--tRNA ligase beta chain